MAATLEHLDGPNGLNDNPSGVTQLAWLAVVADTTNIPDISRDVANAVDNPSLVVANGDIEFDVDKGMIRVYSTQNTGKLSYEMVGSTDGKTMKGMWEFFYPGDDEATSAQVKLLKNNRLIGVVELLNGKKKMLGSSKIYMTMEKATKTTGTIDGQDVVGWSLMFQNHEIWEMYYDGLITEKA